MNGWKKIRHENDFHYIATAHHLNDSIETVIYNFAKGCGIRGLHGILPKKDKIIRPLLFAQREEIESFMVLKKLSHREDASNASDKYSRNFIRHQVVPKLKELNPSFEKTTSSTIKKSEKRNLFLSKPLSNTGIRLLLKKRMKCILIIKRYHRMRRIRFSLSS